MTDWVEYPAALRVEGRRIVARWEWGASHWRELSVHLDSPRGRLWKKIHKEQKNPTVTIFLDPNDYLKMYEDRPTYSPDWSKPFETRMFLGLTLLLISAPLLYFSGRSASVRLLRRTRSRVVFVCASTTWVMVLLAAAVSGGFDKEALIPAYVAGGIAALGVALLTWLSGFVSSSRGPWHAALASGGALLLILICLAVLVGKASGQTFLASAVAAAVNGLVTFGTAWLWFIHDAEPAS